MTDRLTDETQADRDAEAAFDRHIVETYGWTTFASMHTASSAAAYVCAFKAGYLATRKSPRQDGLREALGEALFALSARLKLSGFLGDGDNHAAYEKVVAAFAALSPDDGEGK